jgi:hypothetical protein
MVTAITKTKDNIMNFRSIQSKFFPGGNIFLIRITIILFFCLFLLMNPLNGICQADVEIIPIHYRDASEVLSAVNGLLSSEGRATFDVRTNSLILIDTDETVRRIREFLDTFDTPVQQVKIRLRFHESFSSRDRRVSGSGGVSGDGWEVHTGKKRKNGVEIQLDDKHGDRRRTSEHFIITTSGSPAYILTGKEIPYKERWTYLCRRYAVCADTISVRTIETGMEILPVIVGDRANIDITPRISHTDPDEGEGAVRFTRASTRLSVPLGEWVDIGGTGEKSNEVLNAILESATGDQQSTLAISLMVETF